MNFDWFPRLFIGRHARILGISVSLGVVIPLKFLFDSNQNSNSTSAVTRSSADKMGPQVLSGTRLSFHEPVFIVKKGLFGGSPVAAEFVTELPSGSIRVKEVESGKSVDVPRDQLHLRYR
jgi:hypothetical protein